MDRREALRRMSFLFGGAVIGSQLFLEGCVRQASPAVAELFADNYIDFLGNIAETIVPQTNTPGAKEAGVGAFIPVVVRDCYTEEEQKIFLKGLETIDELAESKYGKKFQQLSAEQRTALLTEIDTERVDYEKKEEANKPVHYFSMLRQLTILGFFTSELGATKALRYVAVPGKYDGDYPYKKGDRAWAL
ncbi:gluconate 2-dehydrogenase subunit 3 family protein [Sphingobacterium sp. LRF_L2]|uniref:gluconate 2-dehydrogenase subunit 3 family protein n=1 Tax=Sphingobacterium sp. LRF_L2 TaxID=3369421 RepID=UPI003F5E8EDA